MLLINQYSSIDQIPKNAWNDIVDQYNPFCRWEFLKAIEINQKEIKYKKISNPYYLVLLDNNKNIVAHFPIQVIHKHYPEEFIYDESWKDIVFYPKISTRIPTIGHCIDTISLKSKSYAQEAYELIVKYLFYFVEKENISSVHVDFSNEKLAGVLKKYDFIRRINPRLIFKNNSFSSYQKYLSALKSDYRIEISTLSKKLSLDKYNFTTVEGQQITADQIKCFSRLHYANCKKYNAERMCYSYNMCEHLKKYFNEELVLFIADKKTIMGTCLCFKIKNKLYVSKWGARAGLNNIYFMCVYINTIKYSIENDIEIIDCSSHSKFNYDITQLGALKSRFGFSPEISYSHHYILKESLHIKYERQTIKKNLLTIEAIQFYQKRSPFKIKQNGSAN